MYYLNDGVYGSLKFFLRDTDSVKIQPYPHRVSINNLTMYDHCI